MTANLEKTPVPSGPSTHHLARPEERACVVTRPGRARPHRALTAAGLVFASVPLMLGAAAASGVPTNAAQLASRPSPSNTAGSPAEKALAFARCMRRQGLADFPDPNSSGNFPPSAKQIGLSNPNQFQEARTACSKLLPNGGNGPTPAQWQQILRTMVEFSRCMRHHGAPNWPDPTYDVHGRPVFNVNIDPQSPQFTAEIHACQHLLVDYGSRPGWPDLSNYFEQARD